MHRTRQRPTTGGSGGAEVGALVPAQVSTWARDSALLAAAGLGAGAALLIMDQTLAGSLLLPAAAGAAMARALQGRRAQRRHHLQYRVRQALAPVLGLRKVDRRAVQMTRWAGTSQAPVPTHVRIWYASGAPDGTQAWLSTVIETVARRVGADYEVLEHDRRRCILRLQRFWPQEVLAAQQRLEKLLTAPAQLGPTARLADLRVQDGQIQGFTVQHEVLPKLASPAQRRTISARVGTLLCGRWRADWDVVNDQVQFQVRPDLPGSVWLPVPDEDEGQDALGAYDTLQIPVAADEDGGTITWKPRFSPHALFVGTTGSGKTSTMHAVLAQFTKRGWPVWVLDAKRVEFLQFRDWPNVQIVAGKSQAGRARLDGVIPQQIAVIHRAWLLMQYRLELLENEQAREEDFEPLLLMVDEFTEFRANLLAWYTQIKQKGEARLPPALEEVASLLRLARTTRIHLCIGMQRPDIELLGGGEMRDNLRFRVSMGRLSPKGAQMMWEVVSVGTSLPPGRVGRAITINGEGEFTEVQCHRFPSFHSPAGSHEARLLQAIRASTVHHRRLVIVPPDESTLQDGDRLGYEDYADAAWAWAEDRPDLDPLRQAPPTPHTPQERRDLASPAASLGLHPGTTTPQTTQDRPPLHLVTPAPSGSAAGTDTEQIPAATPTTDRGTRFPYDDETPGTEDVEGLDYTDLTTQGPYDLEPGDLIEIDGAWVVVEETPLDEGDGLVAVCWRSDGEDCGVLSLPQDDVLTVRRPVEDPALQPF